jgi:hypothetical protein
VKRRAGWKSVAAGGLVASGSRADVGTVWVRAERTPRFPDKCLAASTDRLAQAGLWRSGKAGAVALPGKPEGSVWYVVGQAAADRSPCGKAGTPELIGLFQKGDGWYAVNTRLCSGDPMALTLQILRTYKAR